MKHVTKPEDVAAREITFGVETETAIPVTAGINIGNYHGGLPVQTGIGADGEITAPSFNGLRWRAERDGSIEAGVGHIACEFVSPILKGEAGIQALRSMLGFIREIGGKVNQSCGCHITIGIASVIGTSDSDKVADFCRKLAHIAQMNAWAIYAQTGTDRHTNRFAGQFSAEIERIMSDLVRRRDEVSRRSLPLQCNRYCMVNFNKVFTHGVVEFRAFAGTLNESKMLHHLATVLGICRRAATAGVVGRFNRKATKKHSKIANATEALRRMWRTFGWVDSVPGRTCALGLFGPLHSEFGTFREVAVEMAQKFETRFPNANL